ITTTGLPVQSWQAQSQSMISVQSRRAEGPSWPVPIWSGPSVCSTQAQCTV
ncbi:Erythroid differentiation-related factor 1, partial [Dissostichus eleginoides]